MYTTCLFCHASLGANEVIEPFPVGRRLAFDAEKGRLWVVCRKCERWNLSPLEERWEAIEQCERAYRGTKLRMATDQIGLARLSEGLELVRVGRPLRPEFAAWRYASRFSRRRRGYILGIGGAAAVGALVVIAGPVTGIISSGAVSVMNYGAQAVLQYRRRRHVVARVSAADGRILSLTPQNIQKARLALSHGERGLSVPYARMSLVHGSGREERSGAGEIWLTGPEAVRAASLLMPRVNVTGGSAREVREAVALLDRTGGIEPLFATAHDARPPRATQWEGPSDEPRLAQLDRTVRLALEMGAHEESERRALEGELAELERAWRDAEEIANIADDLFVPEPVRAWMEKHRG